MLWAQAQQRGWEWARDKEVVGDGVSWVWKLAQEHFYDGCQVVDWYHALEHLSDMAELLHGMESGGHRAADSHLRRDHERLL